MDTQLDTNWLGRRTECSLLDAEGQKIVDDFDKSLIPHRTLAKARKELERAILSPGNRLIIAVVGPAGVGKTTLMEMVDSILWKRAAADTNWDRGRIPTGKVEMRLLPGKPFGWSDYLVDALEAFHEPLIPYKKRVTYSELFPLDIGRIPKLSWRAKGVIYDELGSLWITKDARLNGLYFALISTLYYRRPYCFMNDEAHHLLAIPSSQKLLDQMNAIKSLSNTSGVVIVLFGIYDMSLLLHLNDQLSRRIRIIEFPRYDARIQADFRAYENALRLFEKALPADIQQKLLPHSLWFYERTCGLIGILKDWLVDALVAWLLESSSLTFMDACLETAPPDLEVVKRAAAIQEGERLFRVTKEELREARTSMGLANKAIKAPTKNRKQGRVAMPGPRSYPLGDIRSLQNIPDAGSEEDRGSGQ